MVAGAMAYSGTGALVPFFARAFSLPHAQLGYAATAIVVGGTLTSAASGALTDKFGDRAMLLASGLVMGGSLLAAAAVANYGWVLGCLCLYGIAFAASNPAGTHAILFFFPKERRGFAMGVRQTGVPLGGVCGALLFTYVAAHDGYRTTLVVAGALVLAISTLAAVAYREPAAIHGERIAVGILMEDVLLMAREPRLLLVTLTSMLLFVVQTIFIGFLPITLVSQAGYSTTVAALLFASGHVAGAVGRVVIGRASDAIFGGRRMLPLIFAALLATLGALGVASVATLPPWAVAPVVVLLGFAGEGTFGLVLIAMAEIGGEEHAGGALGFGLTLTFAAGIGAPLLFGLVAGRYGYAAAWTLAAASGVLAALSAAIAHQRADAALLRQHR